MENQANIPYQQLRNEQQPPNFPPTNNPYNNYQQANQNNNQQVPNYGGNPNPNYNNVQQPYMPPQQPVYNPQPQMNPYNNVGYIPAPANYIAGSGLICPFCRRETDSFPKKSPGGVTWIWCFALFLFTGVCCCIPFCVDSCQDTELVCLTCQQVKARSQANCC